MTINVRRPPLQRRRRRIVPRARRLRVPQRRRRRWPRPPVWILRRRPILVLGSPSSPTLPLPSVKPSLARFTPQVRQSLKRGGLTVGVWLDRLAQADQFLVRFINRFYHTAGFEEVVHDYYGGQYQRAGALLAVRLAQKLADRSPDFARCIGFTRVVGLAPGGHLIRTIAVTSSQTQYQVRPEARLSPIVLRSQLQRDVALFGSPERARWVFDGKRLGMKKQQVVQAIRRHLASVGGQGSSPITIRRWLAALDRIVVVL